jgi:hypothetical protein
LPIAKLEPVRPPSAHEWPGILSTLLDTNVLSELQRAQPHPAVLAWSAGQPADGLFVSAAAPAGRSRNSMPRLPRPR